MDAATVVGLAVTLVAVGFVMSRFISDDWKKLKEGTRSVGDVIMGAALGLFICVIWGSILFLFVHGCVERMGKTRMPPPSYVEPQDLQRF